MKPDKSNALRVVVKGDKFAAARAASERGIPFVFVREVRRHGNVQTVGWIPKAFRDKAAEWLTAPPCSPPFPDGALLLY